MDRATRSGFPVVLDRRLLSRLMGLDDYLAAAEAAFLAHAHGRTRMPMPLHIEVEQGGFHAKGAFVALDRTWVAVKVNSNFPGNPAKGLPTIQGAVLLYDADDGRLVAILDSMEITSKRTAAASALAARHLAREDSDTLAVIGCGEQGRAQLAAIARVRRLRRVLAWDAQPGRAAEYAAAMGRALGIDVNAAPSVQAAVHSADIVITATTAQQAFLGRDDVRAGSFVAAVGADNPRKSELHTDLVASSKVVADSLDQACLMGDLHHAIAAGAATRDSAHAELAEVVSGRKPGRTSETEIIIFDSTGLAIQDVAAAAAAYARFVSADTSFHEPEDRGNQG
ncbi:MAG TPA: ornithine cyclodeaminase family protein [Usitatibacter sp.]|nr:ornithine cyclodeaminase family protein [Usitatibacter sp.]